MANLLAVVLGAGASSDCVAQGGITEFDPNWKPPLTAELFEARGHFSQILQNFPRVSAISEEIRLRLRRKENLEDILSNLMSAHDLQVKKQVWEVAFYLQDLLWTVSEKFVTSGGTKYDTLVNRLLRSESFDQILFFTLNYDLLLERSIKVLDDVSLLSLDEYCPREKKWKLVKPHGSVNWGKKLLNGPSSTHDANALLTRLQEEPSLAPEIEIIGERPYSRLQNEQSPQLLFPAMALPAKGEKQFICPTKHLEEAKQFFAQCSTFLFVGFSGLDPHVLNLFAQVHAVERIKIVNGNQAWGEMLYNGLLSVNQKFRTEGMGGAGTPIFDGGFRTFMEDSSFETFISP